MAWFVGNIAVSPALNNFLLGHYEMGPTSNGYPSWGPPTASDMIMVANSETEVLIRGALVFGLVTVFSASVSFLLYRALKNLGPTS